MSDSLRLRVGRRAAVEFIFASGETEQFTIEIVPDEQADFEHGLVGAGTPLAKALSHCQAGDQVDYQMGDIMAIQVLMVEHGTASGTSDAAQAPTGGARPRPKRSRTHQCPELRIVV